MSDFTDEAWERWERRADYLRCSAMDGDFARGQRAALPRESAGKLYNITQGTFARGMRQLPPVAVDDE